MVAFVVGICALWGDLNLIYENFRITMTPDTSSVCCCRFVTLILTRGLLSSRSLEKHCSGTQSWPKRIHSGLEVSSAQIFGMLITAVWLFAPLLLTWLL